MFATVAGGDPATALRLGASMVALQASIGALNDLIDAPTDAGRKPGKPIPAGLVTRLEARWVVGLGAVGGFLLALASGPGLAVVALLILVVGFGYDLLAKGRPWSFVPFAVGIPLLPVFGWFGVTGGVPAAFGVLLPAAVAAGAALAIANARADLERDRAAGLDSVAIRLGPDGSWVVEAILLGAVIAVAAGSLWFRSGPSGWLAATLAAAVAIAFGLAFGRGASPARRERGWEVEAVGVAALGLAWLTGYGGFA